MQANLMQLFLLVDALKRLYASQFKGARTQAKAIENYDAIAGEVAFSQPEAFFAFVCMFKISADASGADLLKG